MNEKCILVKGLWKSLYQTVDKQSKTIDFLLSAKRGQTSALRLFNEPMKSRGIPDKVTIDKNGANKIAMDALNVRRDVVYRPVLGLGMQNPRSLRSWHLRQLNHIR